MLLFFIGMIRYGKRRSEQGFTVVHAVALAEFDGMHTPDAYGACHWIMLIPRNPRKRTFIAPSSGYGADWVLILDDAVK